MKKIIMGIAVFLFGLCSCGRKAPDVDADNLFEIAPELEVLINSLHLNTPLGTEKVMPYDQYFYERKYDNRTNFINDLDMEVYIVDDVLLGENYDQDKAPYSEQVLTILYKCNNIDGNDYVFDVQDGYVCGRDTVDPCCTDALGLISWKVECSAKDKVAGTYNNFLKSDLDELCEKEIDGVNYKFFLSKSSLGSPRKPLLTIECLFTIDRVHYKIQVRHLYDGD